jgi:hypothetical protein
VELNGVIERLKLSSIVVWKGKKKQERKKIKIHINFVAAEIEEGCWWPRRQEGNGFIFYDKQSSNGIGCS